MRDGGYFLVQVRPGDTLSEIAYRHGVTLARLSHLNDISNPNVIYTGQKLRVPINARTGYSGRDPAPRPVARTASAGSSKPQTKPAPAAPRSSGTVRDTQPPMGDTRFVWPVQGPILSEFGRTPAGQRNDGINIAAPRGTPVRAAAAGTVTYAGNELKGYGNLILIRHDDGYVTAYAHADKLLVARGARVERGQVIAHAGATGDVKQSQVHFEIRRGIKAIDPRPLLVASR